MKRWPLLLAWGVVCGTVHAQQLEHQVSPGETLISIAKRYWGDAGYWRVIQRANPGIRDEHRLRPGSVVVVPMPQAGSGAVALHVSGDATLTRLGATRKLERDGEVRDTDVLDVAPGAYVTLRWPDGVITHLLPGTRLRVVPPAPAGNGPVARTLELQQGAVESAVPKQQGPRHYQIRTRVGAAAVRGTQFGVRLSPQGAMVTDVRDGDVVLAGEGFRPIDLAAGTGARADLTRRQPVATTMLPAPALDDPLVLTPESEVRGAAVEKAQAYELELSTDAEPPATLLHVSGESPVFRLPPLTDGSYRLALRALDAQGIPGRQAERRLTVVSLPSPFLSAPAQGAVLAHDRPARLSCSDVPNARGYEFEILRLDAPQEPRRLRVDGSCATALPTLPVGRYEWRALATRDIAPGRTLRGAWSAPARFAVAERPAAPMPSVSGGGGALRLMWEGVPDASYLVQLARDAAFRSIVQEQRVDAPEAMLQVPVGEAYYVRIRTSTAVGMTSDFSQPRIVRGPHSLATSDGAAVHDAAGTPLAPPR